jgi:hypothetical protein
MSRIGTAMRGAIFDTFWPIYIYFIASIIMAVGLLLHGQFKFALCLFGTSMLSLTAAGGLKFGLFWGDKSQRIGVPIVALLIFAVAHWLSGGFSVQLFGYYISGLTWGIVGAVIGFLFINRKMATE